LLAECLRQVLFEVLDSAVEPEGAFVGGEQPQRTGGQPSHGLVVTSRGSCP
jgi:hypothetical protein